MLGGHRLEPLDPPLTSTTLLPAHALLLKQTVIPHSFLFFHFTVEDFPIVYALIFLGPPGVVKQQDNMAYTRFHLGLALMVIVPQIAHASGPGSIPIMSVGPRLARRSNAFQLKPTQAAEHDFTNPDHIKPKKQHIFHFNGAHEPGKSIYASETLPD